MIIHFNNQQNDQNWWWGCYQSQCTYQNDVIFGFSMQFVVNNGVDQTVHETYFDKENVK